MSSSDDEQFHNACSSHIHSTSAEMDPSEQKHCESQTPHSLTQAEDVLYPSESHFRRSTDGPADQEQCSRASNVSPRPPHTVGRSFVSHGHPTGCNWVAQEHGNFPRPPRCTNSGNPDASDVGHPHGPSGGCLDSPSTSLTGQGQPSVSFGTNRSCRPLLTFLYIRWC
jgi:hypothetical protein